MPVQAGGASVCNGSGSGPRADATRRDLRPLLIPRFPLKAAAVSIGPRIQKPDVPDRAKWNQAERAEIFGGTLCCRINVLAAGFAGMGLRSHNGIAMRDSGESITPRRAAYRHRQGTRNGSTATGAPAPSGRAL